ncbi:hypothetical protein Goari_015475 [Gossypium aridum]|uniref:Uncharacterized protein n=1 Tax=Gossypium aridum TaxID=34290 RepID=A0A7J8WGU7_GOSAI|nr:hypothetical protein [Gossypium aridum]
MAAGSGGSLSLPPPCPKSPPEYPDLYGKRRETAKVQMLEREISFLEDVRSFILLLAVPSKQKSEESEVMSPLEVALVSIPCSFVAVARIRDGGVALVLNHNAAGTSRAAKTVAFFGFLRAWTDVADGNVVLNVRRDWLPQAQRATALHFLISKRLGFLVEEEAAELLEDSPTGTMGTSESRVAMAGLKNREGEGVAFLGALVFRGNGREETTRHLERACF